MNDSCADSWYRRFDTILLTPVGDLDAKATEFRAWLDAFDDTVLGMPGRRNARRLWCEDAFAAQGIVRELGRLPDDLDMDVSARVRSWIAVQPGATHNAFQAVWWEYVQLLGLRPASAAEDRTARCGRVRTVRSGESTTPFRSLPTPS